MQRDAPTAPRVPAARRAPGLFDDRVRVTADSLALEAAGHNAAQMLVLRRALAKFDDGSYGECVDCGIDIAPARLAVYPTARRCVGERHRRATARDREAMDQLVGGGGDPAGDEADLRLFRQRLHRSLRRT